jgi:hypothetical protein
MGNSASSGNNLVSTAVAASSDASLKLQLAEREAELEELRRRVAASEAATAQHGVAVAKAEQQAQAAAKGAEPWALCSSCLTTQLSRSMPLSNLSYRLDESRSVAVRGKL